MATEDAQAWQVVVAVVAIACRSHLPELGAAGWISRHAHGGLERKGVAGKF
jgi:hypothetical protein